MQLGALVLPGKKASWLAGAFASSSSLRRVRRVRDAEEAIGDLDAAGSLGSMLGPEAEVDGDNFSGDAPGEGFATYECILSGLGGSGPSRRVKRENSALRASASFRRRRAEAKRWLTSLMVPSPAEDTSSISSLAPPEAMVQGYYIA